jgi:hypothetical protein
MDNDTTKANEGPQPVGPFIGIVIILVVIILGGLYFWGETINQESRDSAAVEDITGAPDTTTAALETMSNSDELSTIESDLKNTPLSDLTNDLSDITLEFKAAE